MNGLGEGMQNYAIGMFVVFLAIALLVIFIVTLIYVFYSRKGRLIRLKIALKKIGIWFGSIFIVVVSWNYYHDAIDRAKATDFDKELSDNEAYKGEYMAEYAYLPGRRIYLRVYRSSDMALIADRTYSYPDAAKLFWSEDSLVYDTRGGSLSLPPTLYDRIMAKLP
jgi:hypothetical protein